MVAERLTRQANFAAAHEACIRVLVSVGVGPLLIKFHVGYVTPRMEHLRAHESKRGMSGHKRHGLPF